MTAFFTTMGGAAGTLCDQLSHSCPLRQRLLLLLCTPRLAGGKLQPRKKPNYALRSVVRTK